MPTYDLHPNWQPLGCESAGHGNGRVTRHRDVIARPHPVDIGSHRYVSYFGDVLLIGVEGWNLAHRQYEEFVSFHKMADPMVEVGLQSSRPADVGTFQCRPTLDFGRDSLLQQGRIQFKPLL